MTEEEFVGKIDQEGGVLAALEYGLSGSVLVDQDSDLAKAWRALEQAWPAFEPLLDVVEGHLEAWV